MSLLPLLLVLPTSAAEPSHEAAVAGRHASLCAALQAAPVPSASSVRALAWDAALDGPCEQGSVPVVWAIRQGRPDVLEALLDAGADPLARDGAGVSALERAAEQRSPDALLSLLARLGPAGEAAWAGRLLEQAIAADDVDRVALLLARGMTLRGVGGMAGLADVWFAANARRSWRVAPWLLARGVPVDVVDADGHTALWHAIGGEGSIGLLHQQGADLLRAGSAQGLMVHAAESDQVEALVWLHFRGASFVDPTPAGWTPLAAAVNAGASYTANFLLDFGAPPEPTPDGRPLLVLSVTKRLWMERKLIAHGADPDEADPAGHTALGEALTQGYPLTVEHLLAAGASATRPDGTDRRPLQHAADTGSWDCVQLLLDAGAGASVTAADPLRVDDGRMRAWLVGDGVPVGTLAEAITRGEAAAAALLIAGGAVPRPEDLRLAVVSGHPERLRWLLQGRDPPTGALRRELLREARAAGVEAGVRTVLREVGEGSAARG
jgi:ankyrin repeat protein